MILLDTIQAIDNATFSGKDVVYICVLLASAIGGWLKLNHTVTGLQNKIGNLEIGRSDDQKAHQKVVLDLKEEFTKSESAFKEDLFAAKNSRHAIRKLSQEQLMEKSKEIKELIDQKDVILHRRIDKTQEDMKGYMEKSDMEHKNLREDMNTIKVNIGSMNSKLDILIAQKK